MKKPIAAASSSLWELSWREEGKPQPPPRGLMVGEQHTVGIPLPTEALEKCSQLKVFIQFQLLVEQQQH